MVQNHCGMGEGWVRKSLFFFLETGSKAELSWSLASARVEMGWEGRGKEREGEGRDIQSYDEVKSRKKSSYW